MQRGSAIGTQLPGGCAGAVQELRSAACDGRGGGRAWGRHGSGVSAALEGHERRLGEA